MKIIRISDDPIPLWSDDLEVAEGTVGEIAVAGPIVTREYFRRPEATALAKISDPARKRSTTAWATSDTETSRAGSGSAAGSRIVSAIRN